MTVVDEIIRKSIHLCTLVIPFGYFVLSKQEMLIIIGILCIIALIIEIIRRFHSKSSLLIENVIGRILRTHELKRITGATWILISSFIAILLFDKWIAQVALLFVVVADAFSALVGKFWGKHILYANKTIEGSLVFLILAIIIVYFFPERHLMIGFIGIFVAFIVDIFAKGVDDNLTIPLASGAAMQSLMWISQSSTTKVLSELI
jgi:dolichol kinase